MKKLLILGTAPNVGEAPFDDESFDIWSVSGAYTRPDVKRVDRIFEMHGERFWKETPGILDILNRFDGEVMMQDVYEEVPRSAKYPLEKVYQEFYRPTMGQVLYVTNTVTFMLMLAYVEGYTHVETYGVFMEHATEYEYQKPNLEYYIGYMIAKGVHIMIHGGDIMKCKFVYGYGEPPILMWTLQRHKELEVGKTEREGELEEAKRALWMQEGAVRYSQDMRKFLGGY